MFWAPRPFKIELPGSPSPRPGTGIAIVATFRNEGPDIAEWIEYHRIVGIDHFFLYDHGSTDDGAAVVARYVEAGLATMIPWRSFALGLDSQVSAYAHATANFGAEFEWFVFVDVDEFVVPTRASSIQQALSSFAGAAAVYVPRVQFGTNGHRVRPAGLVIESYVRRLPYEENDNVKSIAMPSALARPHVHRAKVNGKVVWLPDLDVLRINHYFTKSEAEFAAKIERGWRNSSALKVKQKKDKYANLEALNHKMEPDDVIGRFAPAVRQALATH